MDRSTEEEVAHFSTIPWCAKLLSDPGLTIEPPWGRMLQRPNGHSLISNTLKTNETISACVTFFKTPGPDAKEIPEVSMLMTLQPGLDGYPGLCHGGIVATVLDEILGVCHTINTRLLIHQAKARGEDMDWPVTLTAQLNTKYIRPIRTPATVLLTAVLGKVEGKKMWMNSTMKDEEGNVLAEGESLFIRGVDVGTRKAKL